MDRLLTKGELDDLYFNPPTTMANEYVPTGKILRDITEAQDAKTYELTLKAVGEWLGQFQDGLYTLQLNVKNAIPKLKRGEFPK